MPSERDEQTKLVEDQLNAVSDYVWEQKAPLWGEADGRIVNAKRIDELLNDIRTCLPDDIRLANSIIREEEHIRERAHDESDRMVDDASRTADKIVSDANQEAQKAIDDANRYNSELTASANEYDAKTRDAADSYEAERRAAGDEYYESRTGDADSYYERKIAMAEEDADEIIADAKAEAERLISESEIMRQANERADQRRRDAVLWCNRLHSNARQMADSIMAELMDALEDYLNMVGEDRERLRIHGESGESDTNIAVNNEARVQPRARADENQMPMQQNSASDKYDDEIEYGGEDDDYRNPFSRLGGIFKNRRQSGNDEQDS